MTRVVMAHQIAEREGEENPLASLRSTVVFSSADWGAARDLAWVYGIVVGWDGDPDDEPDEDDGDAMAELAKRHGWPDKHVARLRRLHDAYERLAADSELDDLRARAALAEARAAEAEEALTRVDSLMAHLHTDLVYVGDLRAAIAGPDPAPPLAPAGVLPRTYAELMQQTIPIPRSTDA